MKILSSVIIFLVVISLPTITYAIGVGPMMSINNERIISSNGVSHNEDVLKHFLQGGIKLDEALIYLTKSGEIQIKFRASVFDNFSQVSTKEYIDIHHKNHKIISIQFNFYKNTVYILYVE